MAGACLCAVPEGRCPHTREMAAAAAGHGPQVISRAERIHLQKQQPQEGASLASHVPTPNQSPGPGQCRALIGQARPGCRRMGRGQPSPPPTRAGAGTWRLGSLAPQGTPGRHPRAAPQPHVCCCFGSEFKFTVPAGTPRDLLFTVTRAGCFL